MSARKQLCPRTLRAVARFNRREAARWFDNFARARQSSERERFRAYGDTHDGEADRLLEMAQRIERAQKAGRS